jgi:2-dehydro-3-deoxygluconokinase
VSTEYQREGRADEGSLLPRAPRDGGPEPVLAALGEGLLEVGIERGLDSGLERGFGGDAANVAVMAARMGVPSRLVTRVGDDAVGRLLMDFWKSQGVDLSATAVDSEAPTGIYTNAEGASGGHTFGYYRSGSAASGLSPEDVGAELLADVDLLHVTGITLSISPSAADAARAAVDLARKAGVVVAFDFNYRPQLGADPQAILAMARDADIVLLAHDEAEAVLGTSAPEGVVQALGGRPREVLITHGGGEAQLLTAERSHALDPPPVEVVNAAGAGDALAGAYLAERLRGSAPGDALAPAVAAASISCRRTGCARGYPSADEVAASAAELSASVRTGAGSSALMPR